ncbi:hypothetical protein [Stenotrophomonas sp. Iso1]|uniref:hypothetical protein n=1 Tax=Stenotrophomonas sp. Iso1 TaxID=2977283 RepID=UPI0022B77FEA|nr:hypothetical protein [Stenotrophomonas sp. Iso1]
MNIPADIHTRVVDLTNAMIDAGQSGDTEGAESLYAELSRYCESVAADGRDHPFLWETLADFTDDDRDAIAIYLRALPLASAADAAEYAASICLAVAERHSNLDEFDVARRYALQAEAFAHNTDDLPLRKIIGQFLQDHADAADER